MSPLDTSDTNDVPQEGPLVVRNPDAPRMSLREPHLTPEPTLASPGSCRMAYPLTDRCQFDMLQISGW